MVTVTPSVAWTFSVHGGWFAAQRQQPRDCSCWFTSFINQFRDALGRAWSSTRITRGRAANTWQTRHVDCRRTVGRNVDSIALWRGR